MIKFLRHNDGALPLFSVIILLLYSVVNVLVSGLPHYQDIFQSNHENYVGWLIWVSQIMLVFTVLFLANRVFQQFALLNRISNLPLFLGVVTYCATPSSINHPFVWLALGLILWYLSSVYSSMMGERPKQNAFWSGFALGSAAWFFSPVLFFVPLFFQSGFSSGMLNLRRLIIHIVGFILPTYLIITFVYLIYDEVMWPTWLHNRWAVFNLSDSNFWTLAFMILTHIMLIMAATTSLKSSTIREKRRFFLLITMSLLALVAGIFNNASVWLVLSIIPSSAVFSRLFLQMEKRWVQETIFGIYVLLIIGLNL